MNHELEVSESIQIDVFVERMWGVLTKPDLIKKYLFGTETITDWKVGSSIVFQGEYENQKYCDKGIVKENIPFHKLSYLYWSGFSGIEDKIENYSLITYLIEEINEKMCLFTWNQKGYSSNEGFEHSKNGMIDFLDSIKKIAEEN